MTLQSSKQNRAHVCTIMLKYNGMILNEMRERERERESARFDKIGLCIHQKFTISD